MSALCVWWGKGVISIVIVEHTDGVFSLEFKTRCDEVCEHLNQDDQINTPWGSCGGTEVSDILEIGIQGVNDLTTGVRSRYRCKVPYH